MQNYHRHTSSSNIMTPDSTAMNEDYAIRAVELGHKVISSVEHGWQGNYYEVFELAQKYNLKFIFGAEAYWVKERTEKDRTNAHIIMLAKNEQGRREINTILSEANISGYHYKPRVDLSLLLSLNPENVMITTACIGFWQYEDIDEIVDILHAHFGDNFFLEIQYHLTDAQIILNKKIKDLSIKKSIKLIVGLDSHYIYPEQNEERDYFLESKKIHYGDEDGWFMDYPSDEETIKRFREQGVFDDSDIERAMANTDILLDFEDIVFDKNIKLPVLPKYKHLSKEERSNIYGKLITKKFLEYTKGMSKEEYERYYQGVKDEVQVYKNTGMCDYPLIDYEIVKRGIEKGGVITTTGRGSAPGFFTNTLCGFSKIDRFVSPIKLYPERFMSETRILETHSLPDIDMNLGTPEIFEEAQKEILGAEHAYPMIAFGTLKKKAAFKMYARAKSMDFDLANKISKQISAYEDACKYASDEDKDTIDIYDFVDEEYQEYIDQSKKYWGIIDNKKKAPCAFLLYDGDIKSEIGLIKCKSSTTKKEYITTVIDGAVAEKYKFLKNDLLKVNTVLLTNLAYRNIGIEPHSAVELSQLVSEDDKVWQIYAQGNTVGVNQCEQESTKRKIMRYQPHNISELSAFIAAIRPGFKSMYNLFESRESFEYGIKPFDDLLQTEEFPFSFILYQEQLMTTLNYAGFPMDQCYQIIKDIAKKHPEKVLPLKDRFLDGFANQIRSNCESEHEAQEMALKVWEIVYDNTAYGFNSAHAYAMALDSLYGAWQKANYPYEFYETYLNFYAAEGEKDKVSELVQEMEQAFAIKEGKYKWGIDNRCYKADKDAQLIIPALIGLKGISQKCADKLYQLYEQHNTVKDFCDLWFVLSDATNINNGQVEKLIQIGYFSDFGERQALLDFHELAIQLKPRSQLNKNNDKEIIEKYREHIIQNCTETNALYRDIDANKMLKSIWANMEHDKKMPINKQLSCEQDIFGHVKTKFNIPSDYVYITDVNAKYTNKIIQAHCLKTGEKMTYKVKEKKYELSPIETGMIIKVVEVNEEKRWSKDTNDKWIRIDETETILHKWNIIDCQ